MGIKTYLEDNSPEAREELAKKVEAALEEIGGRAEGYAAGLCPVDTGRLMGSITHATKETQGRAFEYKDKEGNKFNDKVGKGAKENTVYVGTNVEYAPYVELGAQGRAPKHFLLRSITENKEEYKKVVKKHLS